MFGPRQKLERRQPRWHWTLAGTVLLLAGYSSGGGLASRGLASCATFASLNVALGQARVAFVGTVMRTGRHATIATVRVESVWRGVAVPHSAVVRAAPGPETRTFTSGRRYIFFPEARLSRSVFRESACTQTRNYRAWMAKDRPRNAHRP